MSVRTDLEALRTELEDLRTHPGEWLESVLRKRIIVHMTLDKGSDMTIDGSLVAVMADGIVLRASRILNDGAAPTSLAGEVFISRDKVAFAQLDE